MSNSVKAPPVLGEVVKSYDLEVRAVDGGWEILCPPGPLAVFLLAASGSLPEIMGPTIYHFVWLASPQIEGDLIRIEFRDDDPYLVIRFSADLDREITRMIQTLIDLRYRTGQVQFELWGNL